MTSKASRIRWIWGLTVALVLVFQAPAHAYIDPGSGSYIFQVLVGALVGAAVAVKVFWHKILAFLTRGRSRKG
jgi:hypothetical protein